MTELSDEQLIARLKSDPEKVFRTLYDRHSGALLRFIFRFTANRQVTEEILHDIFVELLGGNFREFAAGGLKSWLFTLAKNKSLNSQRRQQEALDPATLVDVNSLEEKTALDFALKRLENSEKSLPTDLLETWRLRQQGHGYQQIADQLSIPLGTVKSRFHRLVLFLREEFEK
jgi:RNA polymerase sigma factor (sigma-70 family)